MPLKIPKEFRFPLVLLGALLAVAIGVLVFVLLRFGTQSPPPEQHATTFGMGTVVQYQVYGGTEEDRNLAIRQGSAAITELESLLAWRESDTALSALNQNAGKEPVALDATTFSLLILSKEVAEQTGGAFDPTILPISSLWDFSNHKNQVPPSTEIAKALQVVDYHQLVLNPQQSTAYLTLAGSGVNLDAVGKGAGCDVVVDAYANTSIAGGLVAVGGSIGLYGEKAPNTPWVVGVRDPDSEDPNQTMGYLSLSGGFISTSGTYEQTFTQQGVTYHHILNPQTGFPVETDLLSATVVCQNGALSDALSTACLLLGAEKSQALLSHYGAEAVFLTKNHTVLCTSGIQQDFTVTSSAFTEETQLLDTNSDFE